MLSMRMTELKKTENQGALANRGNTCYYRALAGPWKSLNFFSRFSRPGKSLKTDMVLESPWICVWRSLKVLELDFLKHHDRTSDWYRMTAAFCPKNNGFARTPIVLTFCIMVHHRWWCLLWRSVICCVFSAEDLTRAGKKPRFLKKDFRLWVFFRF